MLLGWLPLPSPLFSIKVASVAQIALSGSLPSCYSPAIHSSYQRQLYKLARVPEFHLIVLSKVLSWGVREGKKAENKLKEAGEIKENKKTEH